MPRKKAPPKTLYEKGKELLADSSNNNDPDWERIRKRAVSRYFEADLPLGKTAALVIVLIALVVDGGMSVWGFLNWAKATASVVCLVLTALLLILVAVLLHLTGTLSESAFMKLINSAWGKLVNLLSGKSHDSTDGAEKTDGD
jgi:hypothetical protein